MEGEQISRRYFLGFLITVLFVLSFFILSHFRPECPIYFRDKYTTSFFCYKKKVHINCIDPRYLQDILYIVIHRKDISKAISDHIKKYGLESLDALDEISGVGPATLKKLSAFFDVGTCTDGD